jgi:hypothetical protein
MVGTRFSPLFGWIQVKQYWIKREIPFIYSRVAGENGRFQLFGIQFICFFRVVPAGAFPGASFIKLL